MCQRYSPSKDSLLDKWLILMFLNELIFVEASAPFPLKLYSLLESHQQCVCHVQPGPNPGKLYIPECSTPLNTFCKGIWSFMKVTNGIQEFKEAFNMIDHNRFVQNFEKNSTQCDFSWRQGRIHRQWGSSWHACISGQGIKICTKHRFVSTLKLHDMTWTVSGPNRRIPGCDDERGTRPNQLHHVPHPLWRETSGSPFYIFFSSCSSTYSRGRILRRLSRMLLAALTRRMWD